MGDYTVRYSLGTVEVVRKMGQKELAELLLSDYVILISVNEAAAMHRKNKKR